MMVKFYLAKISWSRIMPVIAFFLLFNLYFIRIDRQNYKRIQAYKLNGKIDKIEISQKEQPLIYVNGKKYYMNIYDLNFDQYIKINDSIVKDSGDYRVKVYRVINNTKLLRVFDKY